MFRVFKFKKCSGIVKLKKSTRHPSLEMGSFIGSKGCFISFDFLLKVHGKQLMSCSFGQSGVNVIQQSFELKEELNPDISRHVL